MKKKKSRTTARTRVFVILSSAPNLHVARKIARALLAARAAACVNLIPALESHYWWQGKVESAKEVLLLIKTTQRKIVAVERVIRALHPYEVPEIIALPITRGLPAYLRWIEENV